MKKVVEGAKVLKRQGQDIEDCFEQGKVAEEGVEAPCRETHAAHHSNDFLNRLKTAVSKEPLYAYNG